VRHGFRSESEDVEAKRLLKEKDLDLKKETFFGPEEKKSASKPM